MCVVLVLVGTSGCALTMSAIANHNSQGTACVDSPAFGVIDIGASIGIAAALGASDAHPGWYALPGALGLSGLLGVIGAEQCKGDDTATASNAPPASNSAPSFGDAPVDPNAREATREELGLEPIPSKPPEVRLFDKNGMPLQLPDVPVASPAPVPSPSPTLAPPSAPAPPTCTLDHRKDCPDGYYCSLVSEGTGNCIKIE